MNSQAADRVLVEILGELDIPDSSYERAKLRYEDIAEWFGRPESKCLLFDPHISPQGSFRLGTVVRPVDPDGEYDLDIGCRLRKGISKATHTQKQLKLLIGEELENYRVARRIEEEKEEKHRCWRLKYADAISFHMDVVPSIPESSVRRQMIKEAMARAGATEALAQNVTMHAGAITDNRLQNYGIISDDWRISNSEGYALWFQSRMKLAKALLEKRAVQAKVAQVDNLPVYQWQSPLQRCVQLLKRHRDIMFADEPDCKPISMIITTLAGEAYQGEAEIAEAMFQILSTMGECVRRSTPRVPNPVNPVEDFADKWADPKYRHLNLEENFWRWLEQAQNDLKVISESVDADAIAKHAQKRYGTSLKPEVLRKKLGLGSTGSLLKQAVTPEALSFPPKPIVPSKPAGFAKA